MATVCILNSTTKKVINIIEVEDISNVPSFCIGTGEELATNHTGNIGETWNGSSYDIPVIEDTRTDADKWEDIRDRRNYLLSQTDWTANSDVTMSDAMKTYRQQLRDLPTSQSNPDNVVFPEKP